MKVLITGGAGFIGSHLSERLLSEGFGVVVLDDLSTSSWDNILHLKSNRRFEAVVGSVLDQETVAKVMGDCSAVFHLAAAVGVRLVINNPIRTLETNISGTEVVLREATRLKQRVIIASSSEVYGKNVDIPFREDADLILGPPAVGRWGYACSKLVDEFLGFSYWSELQVPATIVRLFNTVGPRQSAKHGMVLPNLVGQAMRGDPLTVYGTGEQTRSFCYVSEAVECLFRILQSPLTVGEIINIGNDEEISIAKLALVVKKVTGSSSKIVSVPYDVAYRPGFEDLQRRVPSLEKLKRYIGFRPAIPLHEIVQCIKNNFLDNRDRRDEQIRQATGGK
jgi:UDP-glucose 4-epimerase